MTDLFTTLNLCYIHVAFNNAWRVSEVSGAREAGQVSQPVQAYGAGAGKPIQANHNDMIFKVY